MDRQTKGKTPLKVLRTARKRLDKGWIQGGWKSLHRKGDGQKKTEAFYCIEGALTGGATLSEIERREAPEHPICRAGVYVRQAIIEYRDLPENERVCIPDWNDSRFNKQDVLAVMDIAIAKAELDEGPVVLDKVVFPAAAEMNMVSEPKKSKSKTKMKKVKV